MCLLNMWLFYLASTSHGQWFDQVWPRYDYLTMVVRCMRLPCTYQLACNCGVAWLQRLAKFKQTNKQVKKLSTHTLHTQGMASSKKIKVRSLLKARYKGCILQVGCIVHQSPPTHPKSLWLETHNHQTVHDKLQCPWCDAKAWQALWCKPHGP